MTGTNSADSTVSSVVSANSATSAAPAAESQSTASGGFRTILWLTCILMFGLLLLSRSGADPDLWGHVTYGREVIRDGHLHSTTTWSYAVEGYRWVNHENIAEIVMAAADNVGGQTALLLLKSLLTLILLGVPIWAAWRHGAGLVTCFLITTLLALNVSFHWLIRPHMFSYTSAVCIIAILTIGLPGAMKARPGRTNPSEPLRFSCWLWLIPPVMCFWTN
ncbi:MAG: hypothetical protein KDA89_01075, partial [Planctomycetaceae bacterium]|nr:hypothetical protein [Planctomycetaceae bacterium]